MSVTFSASSDSASSAVTASATFCTASPSRFLVPVTTIVRISRVARGVLLLLARLVG